MPKAPNDQMSENPQFHMSCPVISVVMHDYNYIPEKRKFSGILCFCQQCSRRRVRRRVTISLSVR